MLCLYRCCCADSGGKVAQATQVSKPWGLPYTMRELQRLLSDFLNLLFHDPEEPDRLWPWPRLLGTLALMALIGWLLFLLT